MSNNSTLRKVFFEVQNILESGDYKWVSKDHAPEDYFDWSLSYNTTAHSIIATMIEQGDLEAAELL